MIFFSEKTDLEKVSERVADTYGGNETLWTTKIEKIYPVYRDLLFEKKIKPFSLKSGTPLTTVNLISLRVPYSKSDILNYLSVLESMTKSGEISSEWHNPVLHLEVLKDKKEYWDTKKEITKKDPWIDLSSIGKIFSGGISGGLTLGILAVTGYALMNLNKKDKK